MKKRIRLFNFLFDSGIFFVFAIFISLIFHDVIERKLLSYLLIITYYLYYFLFELFMGQTIGKMVTKTKVIYTKDGGNPKFINILLRTLLRLIPFDFLSFLFSSKGIHDLFSKTEVKNI